MNGMRCARIGLLVAGCVGLASCVGPPLVIVPTELPNAAQGTRYAQNLNITENRVVRWNVSEGALPPGMTLASDSGLLSGRPTLSGTYDFTVSVAESWPQRSGARVYTLTVLPQLLVEFNPPPARVDASYEYTPIIDGGVPPYTFSVAGLPAGLDYDAATGKLFGTPPIENTGLRLEITVADEGDPQQAVALRATLVIHPVAVSITTTELPNAAVDQDYTTKLEAADGRQPYVWRITAGVLPLGLRLGRSTGEITGTPPSRAATETFTVSVSDADTPPSSDAREFKLVVPVTITTTTLPTARIGVAYSTSIGASAGLTPYSWELSTGTLPDGLDLDSSTGAILGTPAATASTQTFTVRVTDSDTPPTTAEVELTITILP